MPVHHAIFDRSLISAHHHVQVVQPPHHMLRQFRLDKNHIHTIHDYYIFFFHNKERRYSNNPRRFYCI